MTDAVDPGPVRRAGLAMIAGAPTSDRQSGPMPVVRAEEGTMPGKSGSTLLWPCAWVTARCLIRNYRRKMVDRGRIELPTPGFQSRDRAPCRSTS
jgi:hypothetical protein